jgi:hypothetical protein
MATINNLPDHGQPAKLSACHRSGRAPTDPVLTAALTAMATESGPPGMSEAARLLAAGEPRIMPFVEFGQIRQAIYHELLSIALASRREGFNVWDNLLPGIHSSLGITGAYRLVGVQNTFNHITHHKLQK